MQPEERDPVYLWDMLQAAREVEVMLAGQALEAFPADRALSRAMEWCVELIGEAARRVSAAYRTAHPEIPWREIIGQRDILAHEYGQIDDALLYKTATEDIPVLISRLQGSLPPLDDEWSIHNPEGR